MEVDPTGYYPAPAPELAARILRCQCRRQAASPGTDDDGLDPYRKRNILRGCYTDHGYNRLITLAHVSIRATLFSAAILTS